MKTKLLFTAMVLIGLASANATDRNIATQDEDFLETSRYNYAEPIMFSERGVEFLIFPDGSFDFNTNPGDSYGNFEDSYYYKNDTSKRGSVNITQGAPGTTSRSNNYTSNYGGVLIQHDFDGKVRRIGNIFINYDRVGKVKRVGTVYLNNNRGGLLTQVGGLRITYNSWGEILNSYGMVNYQNSHYNTHFGQSYGTDYSNHSDFDGADDYYYYKIGGEVKKQKKIKK